MSDIFLSYASEDRPWVRSLVSTLERQGWSVWWDRTILPGKTFDQAIQEALDNAKCMIVVWSEASVASDWVKAEAAEGVRRRILVPVLIDDVRLPLEFRRIQAAHLLDWHDTEPHQEFDKVVQAVTHLVGSRKQLERTETEADASAKPLPDMTKPRDEEPFIPMLDLLAEPQAVTEIPILSDITPDRGSEEVLHQIPPLAALEPRSYKLTVHATPTDSAIEIINIGVPYKPGIELASGSYTIQVEREGFKTKCQWVTMSNIDMVIEIALEPDPEASQLALQPTPANSVITLLHTDMEDKAGIELTPGLYDTQRQDEEDKVAHCPLTMSDTDVALDLALDEIPVASMQKDGKVETFQKDERQQRLDRYETRESGTVGKDWLPSKCLGKISFITFAEERYITNFVQRFGKKCFLVWIMVFACLVLIPGMYFVIPKGHERLAFPPSPPREEPGLTLLYNGYEDPTPLPPTVGEEPSWIVADNSHEDAGRQTPIEALPIVESSSSLDTTTLPTPRILEVALAAGVKGRDPEGRLSTQDSCSEWGNIQAPRIDLTKHRQIFLWNRVRSVVKQELLHTYYTTSKRGSQNVWWQKVDAITLGIDSSESWRTWSNKKNLGLGAWKVDITAASAPREVLCTVYFDVVKTAGRKRGGLLSLFRH